MNVKMFEMENKIKKQFEEKVYAEGNLEQLEERIDNLETALAHCMAFIAHKMRLTNAEIHDEEGITDF